MSDVVRSALATVVDGGTLTVEESRDAMGSVMDGEATPALLAAQSSPSAAAASGSRPSKRAS